MSSRCNLLGAHGVMTATLARRGKTSALTTSTLKAHSGNHRWYLGHLP